LNLKTFEFQERAIKEIVFQLSHFIEENIENQTILLQAPTGSGKTIIMSQFVDRLKENLKENGVSKNFAYIWFSIGDGELVNQSKNKFNKYAKGIKTLSFEELINNKELSQGEVAFVNWEKINSKSNNHGIESEGDKTNIKDVLYNTKVPIILIIDESHKNSHTKKAEKIKNIVSPFLTINMTATPLKGINYSHQIKIPENEVVAAGVIKKEALVNPINNNERYGVKRILLEEAIDKRKELKGLYKKYGSNINPLCIIQLENSNERMKKEIINILDDNGISISNNRLAIWLSNEKVNKENLEKLDSKIDFLLFKQAVATGWDCPRAQILVKFRTSKSENFEKQVIGRIFRMPELKFYPDERLNKAYIYTNDKQFVIDSKDEKFKIKETIEAKLKHSEVLDLKLPKEKVIAEKLMYNQDDLAAILNRKLNRNYKEINLKEKSFSHNIKELVENDSFNIDLKQDNTASLKSGGFDSLSDKKLDYENSSKTIKKSNEDNYYDYLKKLKEIDQNARHDIRLLFENVFCSRYLDFDPNRVEDLTKIKKLYLFNHNNYFKPLFIEVLREYKRTKKLDKKVFKTTFEFPAKEKYDKENKTIEEPEKYLYDKYIYNKNNMYKTETSFERFLEESEKVVWWYKNKDQAEEAFSISYELKGVKFNHYPDYIIKTNNGIGIFEVKHEGDDSLASKKKAIALKNYIKANIEDFYTDNHLHLFGGQVRELADTGSWKVFVGAEESFSEEITEECWKRIETII
jgi:type III restriction enzyme